MDQAQILDANKKNYEDLYAKEQAFLRYPADWIIRFYNMYLKREVPKGRTLDYGCGSANNSLLLIDKGYETYGVDVSPSFVGLVEKNLEKNGYPKDLAKRYTLIKPDATRLPYADGYFDFILSNQVLYYLPNKEHIQSVCRELSRVLRPGGVVFFTMMGPKNYYITRYTKAQHGSNVHEIRVDTPGHRLEGVQELIYLVHDEKELRDLFGTFSCVTTGYFDQSMFDMESNFHWIYVGKKK